MDNITLFTYSHTNCMDVWEPYLDSLDKYIPAVPSVVMVNEDYEDHGRHKFCLYDETKNYCDEYIRCLTETVSTKYFLYMQEDFILYDHVDTKALQRYTEFLDAGSCSFVRLIRCGDVTQTCVADDLYWITEPSSSHASVNSFSMQPTIWNTERFIELYRATKKQRFGESASFAENMNRLSISGVYAYNGEPMRKNSQHYDSSVFPYIATAVVGGRWNITEYSDELRLIFEKYEINPNARGIR